MFKWLGNAPEYVAVLRISSAISRHADLLRVTGV
jgi:hypothetical protein